MKRILTIVSVLSLALVLTSGAMAAGETYGWTLSLSNTDPLVNAGAAFGGVGTAYLWLNCNSVDGAAAFGCNVTATNGAIVAGFTASPGVLNAGTATAPALAIGGCPSGPFLAGSFLVVGAATDMCLDTAITVDCDQIHPTEWPSAVIGLSAGGGVVCETGDQCTPVSTEESSWGSIKTLYR
jgi:hypothetical protein